MRLVLKNLSKVGMKGFKQTSIGIFFTCSTIYAGSLLQPDANEPAKKSYVITTDPNYSVQTHFTTLIMQPFANNLDYTAEALPFNYGDSQPAISPSWRIKEISPDLHFGFDVGVAGVFHRAESVLMLNWQRYHSPKDSDATTVSSQTYMVGPFFEIGPDASDYKTSKASTYFHFDEVNANYGTLVPIGKLLRMNLFAGLSFTRLLQERFTSFSNMAGDTVRTIKVPSKFKGSASAV